VADISVADIKKLRDTTGAGMMDAKKALVEAGGEFEAAVTALRKKGAARAAKRADREATAGLVESYVHSGRIGVLVEVNCETDFVARTDDFKAFARDVAMHIAAAAPEYLTPESVPAEVVAKEREIYAAEAGDKPDDITKKIVDGKLAKYYESVCLLKQPFIKDPDKTIEQYMTEVAAKVGEKIEISHFSRLELGA
jgi:elongation factor Ts